MEVSGEPLGPTALPPQKDPPIHTKYGLGGSQSWFQCLEKIKSHVSIGLWSLDHPHQVLVLVEVKASVCVSRNMHTNWQLIKCRMCQIT